MAVLGSKAAALLFNGRPDIGETITINGTAFVIVGRVKKISMRTYDYDDRKVYIPITTMQDLFAAERGQYFARRAHLDSVPTVNTRGRDRGTCGGSQRCRAEARFRSRNEGSLQ